jgi:hypothetical protein
LGACFPPVFGASDISTMRLISNNCSVQLNALVIYGRFVLSNSSPFVMRRAKTIGSRQTIVSENAVFLFVEILSISRALLLNN